MNTVHSGRGSPCCFVFAVVGAAHLVAVEVAVGFLRSFTRLPILVVQARAAGRVQHAQVLEVDVPAELDDHQASIYLKTSLPGHLGRHGGRYCYLDSDVIAVGEGVDEVFDCQPGPVAFAHDHADVDTFSRWAVNCGCSARCPHLRESLHSEFGFDGIAPDWQLWNGGVFVFDSSSEPFLALWHSMCLRIMRSPGWKTRDQGALAGAAWRFGLQHQPTLPARFNTIVDCMRGVAPQQRPGLPPERSAVRRDYVLGQAGSPQFLHFINHGVGRRGWPNWDEAAALLAARQGGT